MNNLQFLFSNTLEPETISILDGSVTLYRRLNSRQWQCRFKLDAGSWHQASTASDEVAEATTNAISIYEAVRAKISNGLTVKNKSFKSLALEQLEILEKR